MSHSVISQYYVYCIVGPKSFTFDEYTEFIKSDEVVNDDNIIFITEDRHSKKILIGVKERRKEFLFKNSELYKDLIVVPRHYYKAYTDFYDFFKMEESKTGEEKEEANRINREIIENIISREFNSSFIGFSGSVCYFNIKDVKEYEKAVNGNIFIPGNKEYPIGDMVVELVKDYPVISTIQKQKEINQEFKIILETNYKSSDFVVSNIIKYLEIAQDDIVSTSTVDYEKKNLTQVIITTSDKQIYTKYKNGELKDFSIPKFMDITDNVKFHIVRIYRNIKTNNNKKNKQNFIKQKKYQRNNGFIPPVFKSRQYRKKY